MPPPRYIRLCAASDLKEGASLGFTLKGMNVFAVNKQEHIRVFENRCPHRGTPLEFSPNQFFNLDRSLILCAMHGALFEPHSGLCVYGPCHGQSLRMIDHIVEQGSILIPHEPEHHLDQ